MWFPDCSIAFRNRHNTLHCLWPLLCSIKPSDKKLSTNTFVNQVWKRFDWLHLILWSLMKCFFMYIFKNNYFWRVNSRHDADHWDLKVLFFRSRTRKRLESKENEVYYLSELTRIYNSITCITNKTLPFPAHSSLAKLV